MTQSDFGVHVMGEHVMGVFALELVGGSSPAAAALPQAQAGRLGELLARDLSTLVPGASALDLSTTTSPPRSAPTPTRTA